MQKTELLFIYWQTSVFLYFFNQLSILFAVQKPPGGKHFPASGGNFMFS